MNTPHLDPQFQGHRLFGLDCRHGDYRGVFKSGDDDLYLLATTGGPKFENVLISLTAEDCAFIASFAPKKKST